MHVLRILDAPPPSIQVLVLILDTFGGVFVGMDSVQNTAGRSKLFALLASPNVNLAFLLKLFNILWFWQLLLR